MDLFKKGFFSQSFLIKNPCSYEPDTAKIVTGRRSVRSAFPRGSVGTRNPGSDSYSKAGRLPQNIHGLLNTDYGIAAHCGICIDFSA